MNSHNLYHPRTNCKNYFISRDFLYILSIFSPNQEINPGNFPQVYSFILYIYNAYTGCAQQVRLYRTSENGLPQKRKSIFS